MKTHQVPQSKCPMCGHVFNLASGFGDAKPEPGDLSVCIKCACVLRFDDTLQLVDLSTQELEALPVETRTQLLCYCKALHTINAVTA